MILRLALVVPAALFHQASLCVVWRGWRKVPLGLVAVPVREE
jgi:hypothetical protein